MGFFGKLAFWKKRDDLDDLGKDLGLDKDFGMDKGMGMDMNSVSPPPGPDLGMGMDQQPMQKYPSFQSNQSFQAPTYTPPQPFQQSTNDTYIANKNLEVISSKLDALKAAIDSMNQRVANIETIAKGEQENQRRRVY